MGDTESFAAWDEIFSWFKSRGLKGIMIVTSNDHGGLTEAAAKHFQGNSLQQCQVHLMRNILSQCASRHRADVVAEQNEIWQERKYLDMDDLRDWAAPRNLPADGGKVIAING